MKRRWKFSHRYSTSRADYYVWLWVDENDEPLDVWATPVLAFWGGAA